MASSAFPVVHVCSQAKNAPAKTKNQKYAGKSIIRKRLLILGLLTPFFMNAQDLSTYQNRKQLIQDSYKYATGWTEKILNHDGTINWVEYENIASKAGCDKEIRDYLLGPKYVYYHPTAETFPTLTLQGDTRGWEGQATQFPEGTKAPINTGYGGGWYCQSGPLLYVSDDPNGKGVIQAENGETYHYGETTHHTDPDASSYWMKVNWTSTMADRGYFGKYMWLNPPEFGQPNWNSPRNPIAVTSPRGISSCVAYVAFQNGLIGSFPTHPATYAESFYPVLNWSDVARFDLEPNIYPSVKLPAGKVPMTIATTSAGEFVLVAVWDVVNHKGQMAVIAVKGRILSSEAVARNWSSMMRTGSYLFGFPCWANTRDMKLLGFVDLPVAAPTAIAVGTNLGWTGTGRGDIPNYNYHIETLLDNQGERDVWYNSVCPVRYTYANRCKTTARAGYVMIASRSENKVVFLDLQPLLAYYRNMYFTTQARYNETKNTGAGADQWPYTFDHSPEQTPTVAYTIDVTDPTAVATGLNAGMCSTNCPQCDGTNNWRVSSFEDQYAYVTTMDGRLLIYSIGGLNTEAAATQPVLNKKITIGKNPSSIENGNGGVYKNDIVINCRGDKSIYILQPGGDLVSVLRDSRILDPVMAENSYNGRGQFHRSFIHVVDFAAKNVLTYVYGDNMNFSRPITFGAASDPVPGFPFAYQQDEVP